MATSVGFRAATQLPQAVRQTTVLPTAFPELPDSAVMGDKAARRVVINKYNEDVRTWWRSSRASIQSDYESIASGTNTAISAATSANDALRKETTTRTSDIESLVREIETLSIQVGVAHVYLQTEAPEHPVRGDLWYDTDDNFRRWWYDGSAWVDASDRNAATVGALTQEQQVRITADSALAQRIDSAVAQITDAQQGITGLSTSLESVTTSVTNQGGAITALGTRTTALESTVNTAGTGLTARVSTIESTYATKDGAQGYATAAKSEAITASNTYTDTKTSAAITTESKARSDADSALATRTTALESTVNTAGTGLTARVSTIESTYATKDGAQGYATAAKSEAITASNTYTDTKTSAAITTESKARSDADSALATRTTALESTVNTAGTGLTARVSTIESTYATGSEVSAAIASEVSARNGAISAAVTTETNARVAADGAIHARWGVAINANGAVVGRVNLDGTNQSSSFTVEATKFTVWNGTAAVAPFQVVDNKVRIASLSLVSSDISDRSLANIDSAAATKLGGIAAGADVTLNAINGGLTINSGGVTLAGTGAIKSSNFAAGSTGWQIDAEGDAEFNSIILRNPLMYYPLAVPALSKSQLFANSLAVIATAGTGQTIRYTSDGTTVTATSTEWPKTSGSYTTLLITDTTTIRMRAFNGALQSDEVVATFTRNDMVVGNLTNDNCTCPSASDGSSTVLTNASTTMAVYLGAKDDSANWTFTATPSSGVTGTLSGRTWTTTGFTVDSGYVTMAATKTGIGTVEKRFTLSKAKAGAAGATGATGLNSATIMLYKRAASTPSNPTTVSTYTFATTVLTGHDGGWTQSVPDNNGNPLWVIAATASASTATDTIAANEWSAPVILAANGTNGVNGIDGADGIPGSANMLDNSDFLKAADGWCAGWYNTDIQHYYGRVADGDTWALKNGGTVSIAISGTPISNRVFDLNYATMIPVRAGQRYQASGYIGCHRCAGLLCIAWQTSAGAAILENYGSVIAADTMLGGQVLSGYGRTSLIVAAPANAAFANVFFRATTNGSSNPYLFMTRAFFGEASDAQSTPSPWSAKASPALSVASLYLYQRAASAPALPSAAATYTFSTKVLTGLTNGWSTTIPAANGLKLWVTTATATSTTDTDSLAASEWAAASVMAENGADSTAYWLMTSASTLKFADSTFSPTTVTFTGKSQTGNGAVGNYSGRFIISESTDGTNFTNKYTSSGNEATKTYTPSATTVRAIRCRFYAAGGTTTQLDEETVPVLVEATQTFSGGGGSGGGNVSTSWVCPPGMSITLTVPAGSRSIQFTGQIVSTGSANQSLNFGIRVGNTIIASDSRSATAVGQSFDVGISGVATCTAGSVTFEIVGSAGVSSAILNGSFIVL